MEVKQSDHFPTAVCAVHVVDGFVVPVEPDAVDVNTCAAANVANDANVDNVANGTNASDFAPDGKLLYPQTISCT